MSSEKRQLDSLSHIAEKSANRPGSVLLSSASDSAIGYHATVLNKFITVTADSNNRQRLLAVGEADAMKRDKFLRRPEASIYLKEEHGIDRAPATLADPRKDNPSFRHIDKVPYYAISDLDDWVRRKLSAVTQAVAKDTSPAAVSSLAKQVTAAAPAKQDDESES